MNRLEGKIAVITGGAGGLGSATAERFADEGATVVIADIFEDRAKATAERIGRGAMGLHFDCGNPDSIEGGIGQVISRFGTIDVLFNNAAATSFEVKQADRTDVATTLELRDLVVNVTMRGVLLGCTYAIPHRTRIGGEWHINK